MSSNQELHVCPTNFEPIHIQTHLEWALLQEVNGWPSFSSSVTSCDDIMLLSENHALERHPKLVHLCSVVHLTTSICNAQWNTCIQLPRAAYVVRRNGGESPLTQWCYIVVDVGKNKVRFRKVWEGEEELQNGLWRVPRLCCLVSQAFDWILGKGPSIGSVKIHQSPRPDRRKGECPMQLRDKPRAWVLRLRSHPRLPRLWNYDIEFTRSFTVLWWRT